MRIRIQPTKMNADPQDPDPEADQNECGSGTLDGREEFDQTLSPIPRVQRITRSLLHTRTS